MTFHDGVMTLVTEGHDITFRQIAVLLLCRYTPQTIRGLSAAMRVAKPAVVRSVDKLEFEMCPGLIKRMEDPTDRRSVLISVTYAGNEFLKKVTPPTSGLSN